jgi:hypothetical protein
MSSLSLRLFKLLSFGLVVVTSTYTVFAQGGPASISGIIIGDDGKVLASVVTMHRTSGPAAGGRAEAGADGAFTITNLPAGAYRICADVKGGGYLDPCAWGPELSSIWLTALPHR